MQRLIAVTLLLAAALPAASAMFTPAERAELVSYWNAPGRYAAGPSAGAATEGPWGPRLTTTGSKWLWDYQKALNIQKGPPSQNPAPQSPEQAEWDRWIQAKVDHDQWLAAAGAARANAPHVSAPADIGPEPPAPGPVPEKLAALVGNPPPFASVVGLLEYTVTFDDGEAYPYRDNVRMRPRFAYYRFSQGTQSFGPALRTLPEEELGKIFASSGMTPSEQRVVGAVSRLEGGFESINTYDTGFVSVGFIQFCTLADGRHSLCDVLAREKADNPDDFARDFQRYGIDVTPEHVLVVVDPATGTELSGGEAVLKVVDDKRLPAVFQRAGRHSIAFRAAQIKVAKSNYWAGDDRVVIQLDGRKIECKVSDVVKSEAALATLFDRKVNRGSISPFADVVANIMREHGLKDVKDVAPYEAEIVKATKYRVDFLQEASLSQPPEPPK